MGKPFDGLAILGRFHARYSSQLQEQGRRHPLCREARLRVFCPGTQLSKDFSQGICQQLSLLSKEAQAHQDEINGSALGTTL